MLRSVIFVNASSCSPLSGAQRDPVPSSHRNAAPQCSGLMHWQLFFGQSSQGVSQSVSVKHGEFKFPDTHCPWSVSPRPARVQTPVLHWQACASPGVSHHASSVLPSTNVHEFHVVPAPSPHPPGLQDPSSVQLTVASFEQTRGAWYMYEVGHAVPSLRSPHPFSSTVTGFTVHRRLMPQMVLTPSPPPNG